MESSLARARSGSVPSEIMVRGAMEGRLPSLGFVPTVWELGEHGGYWFVEGTTDNTVALHALQNWLIETDPEHANDCREFSFTIQDDWYWEPLFADDPSGESELRSVEKHGPSNSKPLMRGVLIQD